MPILIGFCIEVKSGKHGLNPLFEGAGWFYHPLAHATTPAKTTINAKFANLGPILMKFGIKSGAGMVLPPTSLTYFPDQKHTNLVGFDPISMTFCTEVENGEKS